MRTRRSKRSGFAELALASVIIKKKNNAAVAFTKIQTASLALFLKDSPVAQAKR